MLAGRGARWEHVELSEADLPPVELGSGSPSRQETTSPAPGRPQQSIPEKRGRDSNGSPAGTNPKSSKRENGSEDEDISKPNRFSV